MQGLTVDECLHTRPQPLGFPVSDPHKSCHYHCDQCKFVSGSGLAHRPGSHRGEVTYIGANEISHAQEEHTL